MYARARPPMNAYVNSLGGLKSRRRMWAGRAESGGVIRAELAEAGCSSPAAAHLEGDGIAQARVGAAQREGMTPGPGLPEEGAGCSSQVDAVEDPVQAGLGAVGL